MCCHFADNLPIFVGNVTPCYSVLQYYTWPKHKCTTICFVALDTTSLASGGATARAKKSQRNRSQIRRDESRQNSVQNSPNLSDQEIGIKDPRRRRRRRHHSPLIVPWTPILSLSLLSVRLNFPTTTAVSTAPRCCRPPAPSMARRGRRSPASPAVAIALIIFLTYGGGAAPASALVKSVPGFDGALPSKHYAGYVTVEEQHGRNLFYYLVESERDPAKDPLVLWLNGGPGCSSFDGFVYEHGPFNFESGGSAKSLPKLHLNPYSWSKVSSVIYLDSPAGVGLSYSKNTSDYNTGDLKTAADSHTFLLKWFQLYPEFLSNPFYIAGESYAGVYVPTLSHEVVKGLHDGVKPTINFKGYMVGNGVCDTVFDGNALVPFAHGMALISDDIYQEAQTACHGNYWNTTTDKCENALNKVDTSINDLNIYDILEPCYHSKTIKKVTPANTKLPKSFQHLGTTTKPLAVRTRMHGRAWPLRAPVRAGRVPSWQEFARGSRPSGVPCMSDEVATAWLNNDDVRAAIHAQPVSSIGSWLICTNVLDFIHDAGSMISYHKNLTGQGYRAFIYSGDHDMCVPYTGTEAWTRSLGYGVIDSWRPWHLNGQVSGYTQGYEHGLTFATIKGAGHTIPEYKPQESLAFYSRWLAGSKL
uniref:Carboxypeptidase n=1 Tax=Oryza meridionalis TaxID=40149 RepID=A0A0E0FAY5_9ORYZ